MDKNETQMWKILHDFRNWDQSWSNVIAKKPDSVDAFVKSLASKYNISPKENEYEVTGNVHDLKFSEDDMLTFGRIIEGILSKRDAKESSPKEEPKEYTEFDMRESFNAGINRGNYLTEEGILSMKGKFPPFEYWLKSYKK